MKPRRRDRYVTVVCPDCGAEREITSRTRRRNQADGSTPRCPLCARRRTVTPHEDDYWFWLTLFGAKRNGGSARAYIRKHGLPAELAELAKDFKGRPR